MYTYMAGVALQQLMDMVGNTPELCKSLRTEAFRLHKVCFCVLVCVCVCVCERERERERERESVCV
jgi:hypothetical protein